MTTNVSPKTERDIMRVLDTAKNHNMQEVTELVKTQDKFSNVELKAGQASQAKIAANSKKIKKMGVLTTVTGILSGLAAGLSGVGSAVLGGAGASLNSGMEALGTVSRGLGNGVLPLAEGSVSIVHGESTKSVGDGKASSSVAGNIMKGLDETGKGASTASQTAINQNAQITGKEQSILSEDRQSKLYN